MLQFGMSKAEVRMLTVRDGLYNNQTRQIIELPGGQMLVQTEGMFNLFNGISFTQQEYNLEKTISMPGFGDRIHWTDRKGMLWIKDLYRLYIYDPDARRFCYDAAQRLEPSGIKVPELKNMCIDTDSTAWLFTKDGRLLHYDWQHPGRLTMTLTKKEIEAGVCVTNVLKVGKGLYLFFLNTGIVRHWDDRIRKIVAEDRELESELPVSDPCILSLMWHDGRTALISSNRYFGGLYRYDIPTRKWTLLLQTRINSVEKLHDGRLLVTSKDGVYILNKEQITNHGKIQAIPRLYPKSGFAFAHQDRQGGLWIGYETQGIAYQYPPREKAQIIPGSQELHICGMIRIADQLLLGTSKGIFHYDTLHGILASIPNTSIYKCLAVNAESDSTAYVGTQQGMLRLSYDKKSKSWKTVLLGNGKLKGQRHSHFRFAFPIDEDRLLTCNVINALGYIDPIREEFVCLNDHLKELDKYRMPMGAVRLSKKDILIYAQNGIFILDTRKNKIEPFSPISDMMQFSNKFNCAMKDRKGRLWLGTQNGLLLLSGDRTKIHRFTAAEGLSNSCIKSMSEDEKGRMWIGTANGVSRITFTPTDTLIADFGLSDGIPTAEMIERSAVVMPDGKTYFASMDGIVSFHTDIFDNNPSPMPVVLTSFSVCNHPQKLDLQPISLSYDENYLSLQFSSLNYANPAHTHYRYRLNGLDKQWIESNEGNGIGEAHYNALPPGNYVLEIQAAVGDGQWGPSMRKSIQIRPPFWLTWWAKTCYAALVISLLFITQSYYLKKRRLKMERENDDYVNHLFELREEARHQFAKASNIVPGNIAVNAHEEQLVEQMMKAIENNMDNAEYNVDLLARDVAISRTNLYKKMQNMLGITPTDFIRNVRLKHAALLLTETNLNINEIAMQTGFNTPRNFSENFKKTFGVTPTEYRYGKRGNV